MYIKKTAVAVFRKPNAIPPCFSTNLLLNFLLSWLLFSYKAAIGDTLSFWHGNVARQSKFICVWKQFMVVWMWKMSASGSGVPKAVVQVRSVLDEQRPGRPISVTRDENQCRVDAMIQENRRIKQTDNALKLGISQKSAPYHWNVKLQKSLGQVCPETIEWPHEGTHLPYSPDLAPSDFWFFPKLKETLEGHFSLDAEVEAAVRKWISSQPETFFMDRMNKWIERLEKCVAVNGDYVEK